MCIGVRHFMRANIDPGRAGGCRLAQRQLHAGSQPRGPAHCVVRCVTSAAGVLTASPCVPRAEPELGSNVLGKGNSA